MSCSIYQLIEKSAHKWPDHTAIYDEYGSLSFLELSSQVENLVEQLKQQAIKPGSGLGIMVKNSREFIIALFAGLGVEATVMPLSPNLKTEELNKLLIDAPLHAILDDGSGVTPASTTTKYLECGTKQLRLSTLSSKQENFVPHVRHAAFVRFTSGTTGKSKGVILSHESVLERTEAAQTALKLGQNDTVVWVLPMAYHFVVSIVMYVRYGISIAICRDELPQTIIQTTQQYHGTVLYASPMHYRLMAEDSCSEQIPSLKVAISTSSAISKAVTQSFKKRFEIPISQIYGIIEVGLPAGNLNGFTSNDSSIGKALPLYELAILDENYNELPDGAIGQLALRGPGMFDAYLKPPQAREEILVNGWFLTGDLAIRDKEGTVTVAGRKKSLINVSGNKVFPEEVEAVINSHQAIEISRVYSKEHPQMGEIVAAELVLKNGEHIKDSDIYLYCRKKLSTHKIPRQINFVQEISMTGSGKVVRHNGDA